MNNIKKFFVFFFLSFPWMVWADQRYYAWTYQPFIEVDGELDMEYYLTLKVPDRDNSDFNVWEHQIELEYGINRHWDFALYQVFEEKNNAFHYKGFKTRFRYMPWERGQKPIDMVLYFEYIRNKNLDNPSKGEFKLIFGKERGPWDWAVNYTAEGELESDGEFEQKLHMAFSRSLTSGVRLGVEAFGEWEEEESAYYIGPSLSFGHSGFWITVNLAPGINDDANDFMARMIVGIPLGM